MNLKDKTAFFYDYGLFISFARKLSESFGRVLYYSPWKSAFPKSSVAMIGNNIPGIEKVKDFWLKLEDEDASPEKMVFVFPDIGDGDLQVFLRERGCRVWGCGMAEDIELERYKTRLFIQKLGLPVYKFRQITGMKALLEFLRNETDKWIKIGTYRGDSETFHFENFKLSEPKLDDLEYRLGPLKSSMKFLVEDTIPDSKEWGYDGYTIDGMFPSIGIQGVEVKGCGYVGIVRDYKSISKPLRTVNDKLSDTFEKYGYRGLYSSEVRINKNGEGYLLDPCCRGAAPGSGAYQECYANWGDIVWHGASGKLVEPHPIAKYCVEANIHCDTDGRPWHPVYFPKEIAPYVKLRNATRIGNEWHVVNQDQGTILIGSVVATGNTMIEAISKLKKTANQIKGFKIDIQLNSICEAVDSIRESKEMGMDVADDPIPTREQVMNSLE